MAAAALAGSLALILLVFPNQGLVANAGDPYDYGKIAHGFVEHGFDKLTRRSAMLYPHALAVVYWLGGSDFIVQLLHCVLHATTCVLVFLTGAASSVTSAPASSLVLPAVNPMLLRYVAADLYQTCRADAC